MTTTADTDGPIHWDPDLAAFRVTGYDQASAILAGRAGAVTCGAVLW
jgi:hypothetical protein